MRTQPVKVKKLQVNANVARYRVLTSIAACRCVPPGEHGYYPDISLGAPNVTVVAMSDRLD